MTKYFRRKVIKFLTYFFIVFHKHFDCILNQLIYHFQHFNSIIFKTLCYKTGRIL